MVDVWDRVLPRPSSLERRVGAFVCADTMGIVAEGGDVATHLADRLVLELADAGRLFSRHEHALPGDVVLRLAAPRREWGAEGYELEVTADGVVATAAAAHGLWNATRTLVQLFDLHATAVAWPAARVADLPRFAWRGAMLDVARHFFGVDDVLRFIEHIAAFKLNRLHLHLTDDQGWRLEIPGWPTLTDVGGSSAVGGDAGGWFTMADFAAIVAHADAHFVTVVPEIDMPGHTNAALASVPLLNHDGVAAPLYTGKDVGFSSLHPWIPLTRRFIDEVIGAVASATSGRYVHIGGDEAHATSRPEYLELVDMLQHAVAANGKVLVGWEEVAGARIRPESVVQHWLRPESARVAPPGATFLMSPARHTYLDMLHAPGDTVGRRWAGAIDVDTAYEWDPVALGVTHDERRIIGVEAPLWTEKVRTIAQVQELCFPRLLCLAELGWSPQALRSFTEFRPRLAVHTDLLAARGVAVHRSALLSS